MNLIEKIERRDARVGIIGLGYVGLPYRYNCPMKLWRVIA